MLTATPINNSLNDFRHLVELFSRRDDFAAAEKEGKKTYAEHKDEIGEKERANKATLEQLTKDLNEGRITQEEMERRLGDLV